MKRMWYKGFASNFLTGFFTLLPVIITVAIIAWLSGYVVALLGPDTFVGSSLKYLGLKFVTSEIVAYLIGISAVVFSIWGIGVLVQSKAKDIIHHILEIPKKIPLVNSVYGTIQQIVKMIKKDEDEDDFSGMEVVYCTFGTDGGGFLALSPQGTFKFVDGKIVRSVYVPTSPMPVTGGCMFWAEDQITVMEDMSVDSVMQVYLSLGVLAPQAVPSQFHDQVAALHVTREDIDA